MTSTVTDATRRFLESERFESLALRIDVVVIVLLLVLLVERELLRAYLGASASQLVRPFSVVVPPLVLAFVLIVIVRSFGLR